MLAIGTVSRADSVLVIGAVNPEKGCAIVHVANPASTGYWAERIASRIGAGVSRVWSEAPSAFVLKNADFRTLRELATALDPSEIPVIEECGQIELAAVDPVSSFPQDRYMDRLDQRTNFQELFIRRVATGFGAHVYLFDTGISNSSHPDFAGVTFANDFSYNSTFDDPDGHGSKMAALIAGRYTGLAARITLHNFKVLPNSMATGGIMRLIDGIRELRRLGLPPGIVNISLGQRLSTNNPDRAQLAQEIQLASQLGFLFVVSAGNSQREVETPTEAEVPAYMPEVVTVAGTDQWTSTDTRYSLSNFGAPIDIFAPGYQLKTLDRFGAITRVDGTSGATALASAVAATIAERRPASSAGQWRDEMLSNATAIPVQDGQSPNAVGQLFSDIGPVTRGTLSDTTGVAAVCPDGTATVGAVHVTATASSSTGATAIARRILPWANCPNVPIGTGYAHLSVSITDNGPPQVRFFPDPDPSNSNINEAILALAFDEPVSPGARPVALVVALSSNQPNRNYLQPTIDHTGGGSAETDVYVVGMLTSATDVLWVDRWGGTGFDSPTTVVGARNNANVTYAVAGTTTGGSGSGTFGQPIGANDMFIAKGVGGLQQLIHLPIQLRRKGAVRVEDSAMLGDSHTIFVGGTSEPTQGENFSAYLVEVEIQPNYSGPLTVSTEQTQKLFSEFLVSDSRDNWIQSVDFVSGQALNDPWRTIVVSAVTEEPALGQTLGTTQVFSTTLVQPPSLTLPFIPDAFLDYFGGNWGWRREFLGEIPWARKTSSAATSEDIFLCHGQQIEKLNKATGATQYSFRSSNLATFSVVSDTELFVGGDGDSGGMQRLLVR